MPDQDFLSGNSKLIKSLNLYGNNNDNDKDNDNNNNNDKFLFTCQDIYLAYKLIEDANASIPHLP